MSEWNDKTAHQAEMELLDAEKDGAEKSYHLGEADFRGNLTCDPSRHNLLGMNSTEYHLGWESEAQFARAMADMTAAKSKQLETEKATLRAMVNHTENVCRKIVPKGSQRFRVIHANTMAVWLNKDEHGFATFEAAKLRAMDLVESRTSLPGDTVTIEEKGQILFLEEVSS